MNGDLTWLLLTRRTLLSAPVCLLQQLNISRIFPSLTSLAEARILCNLSCSLHTRAKDTASPAIHSAKTTLSQSGSPPLRTETA